MLPEAAKPPKPRSTVFHPELTRLSRLTAGRRLLRWFALGLARLLVFFFIRPKVIGEANLPRRGPVLIVSNHLGDADLVVGMAIVRCPPDPLGKIELYELPVVGKFLDAYGIIWVHRGQPDRKALRAALDGLKEGRLVAIAPEGRESVHGSLEQGTGGAAYLALLSGAPLIPVTFTGTENARIYGNMKRLRRTEVTVTIGQRFWLEELADRKESIQAGTQRIMETLARQLPPEYRGVYQDFKQGESQG